MSVIILGLIIGLAAGVLSGLFGVGGGLIIVPALVLLGLSQREATGTSLAALLLPVGILAVAQYAQRQEVDWRYGLMIALGLAVGAYAGARVAGTLSNLVLQRAFAAILLIVALRLMLGAR
ncbi:MAG: sulfite exporter TauE/SafE family protein [Candidatus Dormibacteria bacterium]